MELAVVDSIKARAILRLDVLEVNCCTRTLRLGKQEFSVALENAAPLPPVKSVNLVLHVTLQIPVFSEAEVMARAAIPCNGAWLIEGTSDQKSPLIMANFVVYHYKESH